MLVVQPASHRSRRCIDADREISHPRDRFQNDRIVSRRPGIRPQRNGPWLATSTPGVADGIGSLQAANDGMVPCSFRTLRAISSSLISEVTGTSPVEVVGVRSAEAWNRFSGLRPGGGIFRVGVRQRRQFRELRYTKPRCVGDRKRVSSLPSTIVAVKVRHHQVLGLHLVVGHPARFYDD